MEAVWPDLGQATDHGAKTRARLNLLVYTSPESLRAAMAAFIEFYNHQRYHEGIGNVTPADVYSGRREEILRRTEEQRQTAIYERFQYSLGQREDLSTGELEAPDCSLPDRLSQSHRCRRRVRGRTAGQPQGR